MARGNIYIVKPHQGIPEGGRKLQVFPDGFAISVEADGTVVVTEDIYALSDADIDEAFKTRRDLLPRKG